MYNDLLIDDSDLDPGIITYMIFGTKNSLPPSYPSEARVCTTFLGEMRGVAPLEAAIVGPRQKFV